MPRTRPPYPPEFRQEAVEVAVRSPRGSALGALLWPSSLSRCTRKAALDSDALDIGRSRTTSIGWIHGVLASVGSVGDAYDNAAAESFVDSFKTELIRDRVWRSRSQLELAVVEYVAWFNNERLHTSLGGIPPHEYERQHARR